MSVESLADLLSKLNSCEEAADILYSADAAEALSSATNAAHVPASVNSAATSASRDDLSVIVARRIDTMVSRLNDLASPTSNVTLTPRMVLYELMDILRQALFTSLPVEMQRAVALTDKAAVTRQFGAYVSSRQIPVTAAAEALHSVSYVSVKLRVELVALQLRRRVQAELQQKDTLASEESVAALVVTETLLEDLMTIYNNVVLTLPVTKAAGAMGNGGDGAAAVARLVPVFEHYFYQLCDWILVLESTMQGPAMAYTQVRRVATDEHRGTAVVDLHRPTAQTAWGILLNERGCLVDIDVSLRVFDKAKQLHRLLQAAPQGAQITKINDKSIPGTRHSSSGSGHVDGAAHAQAVVTALQAATAGRKTVQLTLQSHAFKAAARSMPTEVAFVAPPQGGEGTAGQRVTLVLRRQSTAAEWGFSVDERLYWQHPPLRILSDAAKAFVKEYGRHLRLLAVNGVEALHPSQIEMLVAAAETVVLELLVMPSFSKARRGTTSVSAAAVAGAGGAAPSASPSISSTPDHRAAPVPAAQTVETAPKVKQGSETAADDAWMEAAVAKLLSGSADETANAAVPAVSRGSVAAKDTSASALPAVMEAAVSEATVAVAAVAVATEPPVALETPLVDSVMDRPSPTAAAATVVAAEVKRGRGRPRKAQPEVKRGRGRPRKVLVQETVAAADAADAAADAAEAADGVTPAEAEAQTTTRVAPESSTAAATAPPTPPSAAATSPTEEATPCVFDNNVRLLRLSEGEMVLERPSTEMPWGLPIGRIADTTASPQQLPLRLMSLPPAKSTTASKGHPFLTQFKASPATWFIAEVNGKPATHAKTTLKTIGQLTRMTLRFLRK